MCLSNTSDAEKSVRLYVGFPGSELSLSSSIRMSMGHLCAPSLLKSWEGHVPPPPFALELIHSNICHRSGHLCPPPLSQKLGGSRAPPPPFADPPYSCISMGSGFSYIPIPKSNPHICTCVSHIFARKIVNTTTTYICSFCQLIVIVPDISLHNN